jgi:hypothetical protein
MKKRLKTFFLFFVANVAIGQKITINKYLNGIWKMKCCSEFYEIYFNNKVYYIDNNGKHDSLADQLYCFPKANFFPETPLGINYAKDLKPDSIEIDRNFQLTDKIEIVEIVFYDFEDKQLNGNIKHTGPDYYQINPEKGNDFLGWSHSNSQRLVYYNRVITPKPFLINFYKKIAKSSFKKINNAKSIIHSTSMKLTKTYLIKGDEVEIIEEKEDWLKIRFYGKKTIEGWIKKTDIK